MRTTRAVLFDMDGVLVVTEPLKAEAHASTVRQFGGVVSPAFYSDVMGQSHGAVRVAFCCEGQIDVQPEEYTRTFRQIYHQLLQGNVEITPGVLPLTGRLRRQRYRLAVVSSSCSTTMDKVLNRIGLAELFDARISADDVNKGKPAPEPYLLGLDRLGVSPDSAVAIEDSEAGVESAANAGTRVLALRHSLNVRHDFNRADAVLGSLRQTDAVLATIDSVLRLDTVAHARSKGDR